MSGGFFNVPRDLWQDRTFRDSEMTEREAFIWLVAHAAWKPHSREIAGVTVLLDRGEYAASTRFLAKRWQWSHGKARRFLEKLEKSGVLRRKTGTATGTPTGTGVSIISVCNYNDIQLSENDTRTATGTPTGTNKNTGLKNTGFENSASRARARAREADAFAEEFRHALLKTLNAHPVSGEIVSTGKRLGIDWRKPREWMALGLSEHDILTVAAAVVARPRQAQVGSFKYLDGPMHDYAATGQLPQATEQSHGRSRRPTGADIAEAADRIFENWGQR